MKQIDLYVENDDGEELHYKVQVAFTSDEHKKGLQGVKSLERDEGMLFVFEEEDDVSFWMKDTLIPLTVVFIDSDMEVVAVYDAQPNDETMMTEKAKYVLEVAAGEDIEEGDDVDFDLEDDKYDFNSPMYVLNENGDVQAELDGDERVISRGETITLIRKAKLCKRWKNRSKKKYEKYCKELGRYIFRVFEKQDSREPDTIQVPG